MEAHHPPVASAASADSDATVEEILADLECPHCAYNLRGLRGPVVNCPECGGRCDIAGLVAAEWTRPWWAAPGLRTLQWPAAWAFLAPFMILAFGGLLSMGFRSRTPLILTGVAGLAGWGWLMYRAMRVFGDRYGRGIWLALLAHGLIIAYFVGAIGVVAASMNAAIRFADQNPVAGILVGLWILPFAALIWLARRGDRYMGEQCIGQYLRRSASQFSSASRQIEGGALDDLKVFP